MDAAGIGGAAAGSAARPGMLTPEQEEKFLAPWVVDGLAALRRDFGRDLEFGMTAAGVAATAWRRDGTGEPLTAEDPRGLREQLAARRPS